MSELIDCPLKCSKILYKMWSDYNFKCSRIGLHIPSHFSKLSGISYLSSSIMRIPTSSLNQVSKLGGK